MRGKAFKGDILWHFDCSTKWYDLYWPPCWRARVCPLSFFGLLSAVKQIRKNVTDTAETRDYTFETLSVKIVKREKPGPLIYQKLIRAKSLTPRKSQLKWFQDCNYSDEEGTFNWELAYLMARRCTKSTRVPI